MIIAIDYDNTYTADPNMWNNFVTTALEIGHTVICVTARPETMGQVVLDSIGKLVPVIFAGGEWKREVAVSRGYKVDVWIDDAPEYIGPQTIIGHR